MYRIIGADGRQYGPASVEQLREWIAQGRANALTVACAEGSLDWKPLGQLPEFAGRFAAPPVPPVLQAPPDLRKSKLAAGLLGIFVGSFGVHRFYLGYTGIALAQLLITVLTCGIGACISGLWGFIEGILILTGTGITTDADGRPLRDT